MPPGKLLRARGQDKAFVLYRQPGIVVSLRNVLLNNLLQQPSIKCHLPFLIITGLMTAFDITNLECNTVCILTFTRTKLN